MSAGTAALRGRSWSIAARAVVVASLAMSSFTMSSIVCAAPASDPPANVPMKTPHARPVGQGSATGSPPAPTNPPSPPRTVEELDLSAAVFKSAFEAADQDYARSPSRGAFGSEPSSRQTQVDRSFQAAQIEGCGTDPLKFDPLPVWGDFVMGIFAVPYMLHAVATGRCKL